MKLWSSEIDDWDFGRVISIFTWKSKFQSQKLTPKFVLNKSIM